MSTKEIIQTILGREDVSASSFAKIIGVTPTQIYDLQSGKIKKISAGIGNKIITKYPQYNLSWLLTGDSPMLNDSPYKIDEIEIPTQEELEALSKMAKMKNHNYRLVPLINIDSVGGLYSENITTPSEQYAIKLIPFTEAREGDVAIFQSGNSMYPTIPSGSILLIREVKEWKEYFGYGGIYVLWLKDGRRITKEIRRYDADAKNYVWCVSYNPDVADEELPRSMIRGVWKVIKFQADFGW